MGRSNCSEVLTYIGLPVDLYAFPFSLYDFVQVKETLSHCKFASFRNRQNHFEKRKNQDCLSIPRLDDCWTFVYFAISQVAQQKNNDKSQKLQVTETHFSLTL